MGNEIQKNELSHSAELRLMRHVIPQATAFERVTRLAFEPQSQQIAVQHFYSDIPDCYYFRSCYRK